MIGSPDRITLKAIGLPLHPSLIATQRFIAFMPAYQHCTWGLKFRNSPIGLQWTQEVNVKIQLNTLFEIEYGL